MVLADFGDVRQRARFVSNDGAQTLVSDTCTVRRANYGENFALLPQGDKQRFAILISGKNAEQLSLEVPLC